MARPGSQAVRGIFQRLNGSGVLCIDTQSRHSVLTGSANTPAAQGGQAARLRYILQTLVATAFSSSDRMAPHRAGVACPGAGLMGAGAAPNKQRASPGVAHSGPANRQTACTHGRELKLSGFWMQVASASTHLADSQDFTGPASTRSCLCLHLKLQWDCRACLHVPHVLLWTHGQHAGAGVVLPQPPGPWPSSRAPLAPCRVYVTAPASNGPSYKELQTAQARTLERRAGCLWGG